MKNGDVVRLSHREGRLVVVNTHGTYTVGVWDSARSVYLRVLRDWLLPA